MELACGHCYRALEVPESNFGQKLSCPYCGVRFVVTADRFLFVCPSCGTLHENDIDFCSNCGQTMIASRSVHKKQSSDTNEFRNIFIHFIKIIFGWLFLSYIAYFVIMICFFGYSFQDTLYYAVTKPFPSLAKYLPKPSGNHFDERWVYVKCPNCNDESIIEWKNSKGEVIKRSPNTYCINCKSYYRIPDKYLHPSKTNSLW